MKLEKIYNQSKQELRLYFKQKRREILDKEILDKAIVEKFLSSKFYRNSSTILSYVSTQGEICTDLIIESAFRDGKKVGVPFCEDNNGKMSFYYINSLDDLEIGSFGIREPKQNADNLVNDFDAAIILLPGLAFDKNGYRLGYGKGYYDRFLQIHPLNSVGLCYNSFIVDSLPIDNYDKNTDFIITDSRIIECGDGGKNG